MLSALHQFPSQFTFSAKTSETSQIRNEGVKRIYFAGMGGSALPADLANDYLEGQVSLTIVRDYHLPREVTKGDLVFCASYSGNTEETLCAFEGALERKAQVVVLAHGGKLRQLALEKKLPFVEIPESIQPRCAIGYFFNAILQVLETLKRVPPQKAALEQLAEFLRARQAGHEDEGKKLAKQLKGFVPIIYGPTELEGMCRIWKIKMNENAKIQSFYNVFPELNHNEMVGYTQLLMEPAIICLKSKRMHPRILKRMEVMRQILSDRVPFYSLELEGSSLLQVMFDAHGFGDYTSYYLAKEYGVDPTPVDMVEDFKKKLAGS